MSISPPVIVPDAELGEPLVVALPATVSGKPCSKSTPENATAYCPDVPLVVSEAEENKIVAAAVPEFAPDVAVIVTVCPVGGESGAVYKPAALIVPWHCVAELNGGATQSPPGSPATLHDTPAAGVAVNVCVAPAGTVKTAGLTATGCAATTCTVVVPALEPAVAVIVTLAGADGAVNIPVLSIVPLLAVQVADCPTPARYALNCPVCETGMLADPGTITRSFVGGFGVPPPPPPQAVNTIELAIATATSANSPIFFRIRVLR